MTQTTKARCHGMLFGDRLVRAFLDGIKTQTRRPIKGQQRDEFGDFNGSRLCGPEWYEPVIEGRDGEERPGKSVFGVYSEDGEWGVKCPWNIGDIIWVREAWAYGVTAKGSLSAVVYRADHSARLLLCEDSGQGDPCGIGEEATAWDPGDIRWRPSIHMPRWAARLWYEITDIRVERVNSISHDDVLAEGTQIPVSPDGNPLALLTGKYKPSDYWPCKTFDELKSRPDFGEQWWKCHFAMNWDEHYGATEYAWAKNPWVWALSLKRTEAPQ